MSLDASVAVVRRGVRSALADASGSQSGSVLVACSGGADSLALLAATVFEARSGGVRVVGVVVDHGLQPDSAEHTAAVVAQMAALGVDETASIRVTVDPGPAGIEAGAREARYAALSQLATHFRAGLVLLGHTQDDQAETVLLGLTRGSGGRSLTGMRRSWTEGGVTFARPLLDVTRSQTEGACRAEDVAWWTDPHNADPRFLRSRVRHDVLPVLETRLGPGVAASLARTGEMLRADMDALDDLADALVVDASSLRDQPVALRTRALRRTALAAGCPPSELTREHVVRLDDLLLGTDPTRVVQLPGRLTAYLTAERALAFRATAGT